MQEQQDFGYFIGDEASQYTFFQIPYLLFTNPRFKGLSNDAKLLYGLLLDRMGLSEYNGWYDKQGRVYIYYTVEEVRQDLNCGNDKAMKTLAELDSAKGVGLIERIKQGQGKPTKIYVKRFTTQSIPPEEQEPPAPSMPPVVGVEYSERRTPIFSTPGSRKNRGKGSEKSECNQTNQNQTDFIHTDPSIYPPAVPLDAMIDRYERREEVREQIDYPTLKRKHPYDDVESLLELLVDVLTSTGPTIRIGGESLPTAAVKERFQQLDSSHIEYILDSLKSTTTKIHNIRAYLLTALYNAPVTIGPYYSAAVRHDFGAEN